MSSPRPSAAVLRPAPRPTGVTYTTSAYEVVKVRILIKLQERLDALKARRMPPSLLAEAARQQADQLIETEAARLPRQDRDKLAREVAEEAFGFGPLEEFFADPTVDEITVLGAQAILVRRAGQGSLPTNAHFRDDEQLAEVLDKVRAQGEAVGGKLPDTALDVRLANGFRAVAVIPPAATGAPALIAFVRSEAPPAEVHPGFGASPAAAPHANGSSGAATSPARGSGGGGTQATRSGSGAFPPVTRPGSGSLSAPTPRSGVRPPPPSDAVTDRHRARILERFTAKLAALGVFDLSGIDSAELRKVIAAYVDEYCRTERIFLTDTDRGRVTLEILAGMGR